MENTNSKNKDNFLSGNIILLIALHFAAIFVIVIISRKILYETVHYAICLPRPTPVFFLLKGFLYFSVILFTAFLAKKFLNALSETRVGEKRRLIVLLSWLGMLVLFIAWTYGYVFPRVLRLHRYLGSGVYTYAPNASFPERNNVRIYTTDNEGHRTCAPPKAKPARTIDIAGDSFIFGSHVDDSGTLCESVRTALEKQNPTPTRVRNLGMMGNNLSSAIRTASVHAQKQPADWTIIGYQKWNAFGKMDTCFRLMLVQNSFWFRVSSTLLGINTVNEMLQGVNEISDRPGNRLSKEDHKRIDDMSKRTKVIFISYSGNDPFLTDLKKIHPEITILYFNIYEDSKKDPSLIIPNDGHPSAKFNGLIARDIAAYILKETNSGTGKETP